MIKPFTVAPTYIGDLRIKDNYDYAMELLTAKTIDQWNETIKRIGNIHMRAVIESSGIIHQILPS